MLAIQTTNLKYSFRSGDVLLKKLDLKVPTASIFGLLGKNGAGKTTTLKLILGLYKLQEGEIKIFGKNLLQNRTKILQQIGALIEYPSFYGHLTARENLYIQHKLFRSNKSRIDEILDLMKLEEATDKKVSQFSLGMKQRLAIGSALLHQPKLLILDEPTNGLDPDGIIKLRQLLTAINKQTNTTILISSHLLSEVEKVVSHLCILDHGHIIYQGTMSDVKRKQQEHATIEMRTSDITKTIEILKQVEINFHVQNNMLILPQPDVKKIAHVQRTLASHQIDLHHLHNKEIDLEALFIKLTNK